MRKPPDDQEQFVKRMWPRLVGSMTLITGDRAAAEDLAQEALIRACSTWSSVSAAASADAWTFRVAFNLANSRWRRKGAEGRAYNKVAETGRAPCHQEPDHALRLTLEDVLRTLPVKQRTVIVLRFYGGLSVSETAEAMRCAEGTVKSLTHGAVASLRDRLDIDSASAQREPAPPEPPEPPGSSQSAGARHEADTGTTRPDRPENTSTNDHGKVRFNVN